MTTNSRDGVDALTGGDDLVQAIRGGWYFAHWADVDHARGLHRWLYAPVTAAVGEELRAGKITLREVLLAPERLLVVDQRKVTHTVVAAWEAAPADIPQEVLPDEGEVFGPDDLVTPPRPISCECASPGGLELEIMQRRRACSNANKANTPCRCACHAPGQFVYGRGGGGPDPGTGVALRHG